MKWCERCGGPATRVDQFWLTTVNGCRLCWLERQAHRQNTYDLVLRQVEGHPVDNSPCPHASGWWLPEGAREALVMSIPHGNKDMDRVALQDWLARRSIYRDDHLAGFPHRIGVIAGGYRTR